VSTAKSLFIRRESDVWRSLRSQRATLDEANERLAQWSAEVADLRLLCDGLKSEAAAARTEAASTRAEVLSAREQVASQAEEMRQRQLELDQAIGERDQSWSQAAEAVSRAEALAESLAEAIGSAQSALAEASQQRARAEGMFCLFCDLVFVSILLLASEGCCQAVCGVRDGS
jgi:chromosome segregation ATPase